MPEFLQQTAPVLDEKPQVGFVASHVEFFGDRAGIWQTIDYSATTMLWQNCIGSASLFRRKCWEEVRGYADLKACQDWHLWLSFIERGWEWRVVPKVLYRYRKREGSITSYGRANRKELLRQLVEMHRPLYEKNVADIVIECDAEMQRLKDTIQRLTRSTGKFVDPEIERKRKEEERALGVMRFAELVQAKLPRNGRVLVASKGDDELLRLGARQAEHFPQAEDGRYAGYHPETSAAAIAQLEAMRESGSEFFALPPGSMWWLDHYDELRQYLEQHYRVVTRKKDAGVIFDLRSPIVRRSFSVIVCTYKRAEFVGKALQSLFNQDYPKDKFEIVVIDNDSPDDTADVIRRLMPNSPVPISYAAEKRNGLSYARNLGIEKSSNEFVAFLDDDATACPNWLSAFNAVIDEHHALVVGGRVDQVYEDGFTPPDWYNFQYLKGFFGINYRDRKKNDKVFRIRYPLYIGGGNSAYVRQLFKYFGGYDPRLGRDGKTLLAGEETYLNLTLDRNDIPIYYSDDAVIYHFIESYRMTKPHLKDKAWWSGISNGIITHMFFSRDEGRERARSTRQELGKLLRKLLGSRNSLEAFSWRCRITYGIAFLYKYYAVKVRGAFGRKLYKPNPVHWDPAAFAAELSQLPEAAEKYRQLRDFHLAMRDMPAARAAHIGLLSFDPDAGMFPTAAQDQTPKQEEYHRQVACIRQLVRGQLPADEKVIVVSKGDREMVDFGPRKGWHFPQNEDGVYAGYYPASGADALRQLKALRDKGGRYLLFPATSLWWLEHYPELREELEQNARVVIHRPDTCVIYDLAPVPTRVQAAAEMSSQGVA
jgi:glycosyltransferase involved in cell wall biosynthesis